MTTTDHVKPPEEKLFDQRILMLGSEVSETSANTLIAQLLTLEHEDPDAPIVLYVNSPGGEISAMMAIYDAMQHVGPEVHTRCIGIAASAAALILAGGAPGRRAILPHARVLIHQPALSGAMHGQASDIAIHAAEVVRIKDEMIQLLALHSGREAERVRADTERDRWLSAAEAVEYGLVDHILDKRVSHLVALDR